MAVAKLDFKKACFTVLLFTPLNNFQDKIRPTRLVLEAEYIYLNEEFFYYEVQLSYQQWIY